MSLSRAFDELQFGPGKTLNLRDDRPTAVQATARAEAWLRERQVARAGEVLVITGRGKGSDDGIGVVREAVLKLLTTLKRRGVITAVREHTAGSFVVRLAPMTALFDGAQRKREPRMPRQRDPRVLEGLDRDTRQLLRRLAEHALDALGVHGVGGRFITDEMVRQFLALAPSVPEGPERERRLRETIQRALEAYDER